MKDENFAGFSPSVENGNIAFGRSVACYAL